MRRKSEVVPEDIFFLLQHLSKTDLVEIVFTYAVGRVCGRCREIPNDLAKLACHDVQTVHRQLSKVPKQVIQ